jgi:hypothetical protein
LLESQDFITKCFAQKTCSDVFYAVFEKAFDRVSHPKLLFKLKEIGITGKLLEWLSDFLIRRSQRVVMGILYQNSSHLQAEFLKVLY